MIAQELEVSLHMAFVEARQQRHEFITVEHLLLALLDNPSAAEVLRACAANIDDLRKSLSGFIKENTPTVSGTEEVDTQPTLGFQRVIQRAIMHVQSTGSGKKEVTGANVLVAIFGEKDSHAVYYLHQQGVTRLDVVNFIAHGIKKSDPPEPARSGENPSGNNEGEKEEAGGDVSAPRPDLVLLDGGAGQLSAALEIMADLGVDDIPVVGVAKGPDRDAGLERFFLPGAPAPFMLEPRSPVLYFLQRLRDEAHRFAIGTHRAKRSKELVKNPLDEIEGVGPGRKKALLHAFGSARGVSRASVEDLAKVEGVSAALAQRVFDYFRR